MNLRKAAISMAAAIAIAGSSGAALVGMSGVAGAANPSGTQLPDAVITLSPDPVTNLTPAAGTPYSSGQTIAVNVDPNTALSTTGAVKIIECADPGGLPGNLPTSVSSCDTSTIQGDGIIPASDGSFIYGGPNDTIGGNGYQVIALPSAGHSPSPTMCGTAAVPCVLWIGDDYNNFQTHQLWSLPFQVVYTNGHGANPGDGTPEVPLAIGLPLAAAGLFAGGLTLRRRRSAKAKPA